MKTRLTEMFGLKYPIIQAPMAGVSTPLLAATVSNAGALGSLALGALNPAAAAAAVQQTRALSSAPIVANLFVHSSPRLDPQVTEAFLAELAPEFESAGAQAPKFLKEIYRSFNDDDDMLEMLLELRPRAVSLHFGAATASRMQALQQAGILVLATATSVVEALALEDAGVDLLVMQSYDAGGHSGAFLGPPDASTAGRGGLEKLVRDTVAVTRLPVVGAGGLMTGQDVASVIGAGAVGAQMGTAFIACPEAIASERYRALLSTVAPTQLTCSVSGRPARGFVNELLRCVDDLAATPPDYPLCYDAVKQLVAAKKSEDFAVMWAGAGAPHSRSLPAKNLLECLVAELKLALIS